MKTRFILLFTVLSILSMDAAGNRIWTASDGRTMEGTFEGLEDEKVGVRRKENGQVYWLELQSLSEVDQKWVARIKADEARMLGFEEGPWADSIRGEWVKIPKERLGLLFQIYGSEKLRREEEPVPLFIHLHGAGARADDVEVGKVEIAAQRLVREEQYEETPCVVIVPTCPPDVFWGQQVEQLEAVIDEMVNSLPIDRDRIYLSGYSMGARGIGSLMESRPDFYAAAMFADGEAKASWAESVNTALWLWFSGERDMDGAKAAAEAFEAAGKTAHFEGFPELTHNQIHWQLAHDEEVFPWIFSQRRGGSDQVD